MDTRKQSIEQLDGEIARLEHQITSECVDIGKRIAVAAPEQVRHLELQKYLQNIRALRNAIADLHREMDHQKLLFERLEERERERRELEQQSRELARERETRLTDLGAGAYVLYRRLPDRARYSPLFDEVLRVEAEIEKLSSELSGVEEEEKTKGFFEKLKLKTRKVMIRGNITKVEKRKLRAYAEAGGRVADSDFAALATGDLRQMFDFVADKRKALEGLHARLDRLRDEIAEIRADLKKRGAEDDPEMRRRELEQRVRDVEKELEVLYCWTGQMYIERDLRRDVPDEGIAAKFEIIVGMRESIRKRRAQIGKMRAELELDGLLKREKSLRSRRKELEEDKRILERQMNVIDIEIGNSLRRMDDLRRVLSGEISYIEPPPIPAAPDFYRKDAPPEPTPKE